MAKPVKLGKGKVFTFKSAGSKSKYPWDKLCNPDEDKFPGGLVLLEQDEGEKDPKTGTVVNVTKKNDFNMTVDLMINRVRVESRKRYKVAQFSRYDADGNRLENSFIYKVRDMTFDEKHIEDVRRSEVKLRKIREKEAEEAEANEPAPTTAA